MSTTEKTEKNENQMRTDEHNHDNRNTECLSSRNYRNEIQRDYLITDFPDLESDGRLLRQIRDPPGQKSRYIPPGDPTTETYRLSTFKLFPREVQIDVRKLASAGFYFTGFKDRTKCFSCGQSVQEWEFKDDPKLLRWHRSDCDIIHGTETRNIPINSILHQFELTPTHDNENATRSVTRPLTSGYPQASEDQRRQITTGKIITNGIDIRTNSPNATMATLFQTATFRNSLCTTPPPNVVASTIANSHRNLTMNLSNLFPCSNPVNPHMRSEESRLQTFLDHSSSWPSHRIHATPRQISKAGMYYLGVRDRVKCWYCNGGLQNWERNDDPWEEHTKWFPMCEFVLQQKDLDYVHRIVSRFPNLRRPLIQNPANPNQLGNIQSGLILGNGHRNDGPEIIDPREEVRSIETKVDGEMSSSELIQQAKRMGFDERIIKNALKRKYEVTGNGFSRLEILVESILAMEEESASNRSEETSTTPSTESGSEEIRRLQEERTCKVCRNERASVVLIPCGHIACCIGCAEDASICPICRLRIREKVRSFIV
ncbi:baculoviral IAP repeat-containing protein 7-A-like [Clavelina lepadiformis]|uniref:baculoviral IAP repeat-containing protein 7-A-like n=1 Tax=Clavelina lepadiformis TaxID=159417 RepID=UPI0040429B7A